MKRLDTLIKENIQNLESLEQAQNEYSAKLNLVNQEILRLQGEARLLKRLKEEQEPKKDK